MELTQNVATTLGVELNPAQTLNQSQMDALAAKFASQPKNIKKSVRELGFSGPEWLQYAAYILLKTANDYNNAQLRDVWIQRLETLIPRLNTKDEKLKAATDKQVAAIALEIEDVDMRGDIQTILKRNLLPKSTDMIGLIACFERLAEIFVAAWKA